MNDSKVKTTLKAAILMSVLLLFAAAPSFSQVNLTAGPTTTMLPDGTVVPMWGYTCGALVTGSTATCAPLTGSTSSAATGALGGIYVLNGGSGYGTSSPTVNITPAAGNTPTTPAAATAVISGGVVVGFNVTSYGAGYTAAPTITLTGGSGSGATAAAAPAWSPVLITVPAGTTSAPASLTINLTNTLSFTPTGSAPNNIPTSIVIVGQVGGGLGASSTSTASPDHSLAQGCVTWFIASTPPGSPCTSANGGTPPIQGPRVQSMATEVVAGGTTGSTTTSLTWGSLKPGTYLLESGTHPSIQVPMGLIGMLVVTTAPSGTTAGTAYPLVPSTAKTAQIPAVTYSAEVPLEFSEIDPVQNKAVDLAVRTAGFSETAVWSAMNNANAVGAVSSLGLTNGGSGYTAPVTVTISGSGAGATATATLSYGVSGFAGIVGGTGYTTAPTVTLSGGGGSGATATAAIASGAVSAINIVTAGSGYTSAPTVTITGGGGTGASATATLASAGSIATVTLTNPGSGFTSVPAVTVTGTGTPGTGAVIMASIASGGCGQSGINTCYPPAVNYTPFYFLINGEAFDKANPSASLFAATAGVSGTPAVPVTTGISGKILVRMVNAGLRMHVPSIVGSQITGFNSAGGSATVSGFQLIAEDGNPAPDLLAPRVQTDVFMAAGKAYDVMVNVPATPTGASAPPSLPVYDRELSLSANSSTRDAGMLAYIGVNGSALPVAPNTAGSIFAAAMANADMYNAVPLCPSTAASCVPLVVSDVSKGVIANDVNVNGVTLSSSPAHGTLTCNVLASNPVAGICANGTFTYTPNVGTFTSSASTDSFGYCANGAAAGTANLCTTVTLNASSLTGAPSAIAQTYTSKMNTYIKIAPPGLLLGNSDPHNLPLTVVVPATAPAITLAGGAASTGTPTVVMDANGGFVLSIPGNTASGSASFSYTVQNAQGVSSAAGTVTVNLPTPSNLQVHVVDGQQYNNCNLDSACIAALTQITDYRWIIEEDKTFWVDPNCTTNASIATPGCPAVVGTAGSIPVFGVNFHTNSADYIAQGCTGPLSCEGGQTMLDTRPACTAPGVPAGCSSTSGQHIPAVCDVGAGACRPDPSGTAASGTTPVFPSQVHLDPSKRYYISVLPGDAANPFPTYLGTPNCLATPYNPDGTLNTNCGHAMSGAPVPTACNILGGPNACPTAAGATPPAFATVTIAAVPTPLPTGDLSGIVFEDDFPVNGEQDAGGGGATVAPIEPGLGQFNVVLWDTFGGLGDFTGQDSNDAFNQPLSNSLAGMIDPITNQDACPITPIPNNGGPGPGPVQAGGMTGMIVTCPKYEADGTTLSPLAGQFVIHNLMADKFSVQAYPGADRIARGEQWVQTNTLDGQHPHDAFIRIGEPSYFQEYGPAGYHVAIGFANPAIINARRADVCKGFGSPGTVGPCTNTITGQVDVQRLSRTPDQRLYASGTRDALAWTQCWVSLGDPDGEDFEFTFCDADGNFKFTSVPGGEWRLTIGDQWNDQIIDGLSTPANVGCTPNGTNGTTPPGTVVTCPGHQTLDMGHIGVQQWQSNVYTRTFIDDNKNGIFDGTEIGIPLIYTRVRYRDGHNANALTTDFNGISSFNETFPLFNWYTVDADSTRYKTTGTHTVYDAGGPADGSSDCGTSTNGARPCGTSGAYNFLANTYESVPLPADLSVPGAVYCAKADCTAEAATFALGNAIPSTGAAGLSTGRIDSPWFWAEGWSGMTSQGNWIDVGKAPYAACNSTLPVSPTNFCATVTTTAPGSTTSTTTKVGENGGIYGYVQYASTRPFDEASQMVQQPWEPFIPDVTVNLYKEGFAADGVTPTLTLVDTTQSSSWDDWAQGFYPGSTATPGTGQASALKPYMSCPGQGTSTGTNQDLFFFTLFDQPNYLDWYNSLHNGGTLHNLPYNSQFKCYDSMHIWNQLQPAPFDGKYMFPSVLGMSPTTGKPDTSLTGGVGAPVWYFAKPYAIGDVVVYNGTAYTAAAANTGVIPGSTGNTAWTAATTLPTNFVAADMPGTNCTICVGNPDTSDNWRAGTPMLPPGKYVVQVVMPPGFEVYKEEDKNLLIGDNYIGPVTQSVAGVGGAIFIVPDQASVASMYDPTGAGYNPNNFQNSTTATGLTEELSGVPGYPGFTDPVWPCVGETRIVPDYLSLFPQAFEAAPYAGASRPLCDRKEVTLPDQMAVSVKFALFTSTHIASKYTGVITDDLTSEFDPFSPQFGEKFSPPNQPVATRDYLGNEISRVYSDHWGTYDGMTYSSWDVDPPNITGYSPAMMVQCMNDPGPIVDTRAMIVNAAGATVANPTFGQLITDPLYNPAYSDFCYTNPFMPGLTTYNDTPVVPTQAWVGAGYNNPDCSYPDATPAVKEVDGDQIGPYVATAGNALTITALGDTQVNNSAYSGPSANTAPFSLKTIRRHYGFGTQCTSPAAGNPTCNTTSAVTIGGKTASITSWSDTQIIVTVPNGVPACAVQQQTQFGGSTARCGELVITAGNGLQSIDAVTVTIGGKAPTHVSASSKIQSAIDMADPGDLIIIDPTCMTTGASPTSTTCNSSALNAGTPTQTATVAAHSEMLLMWKPVRLQGVGAASSIIDANAEPAGKLLDPWRRHVNCLFGLTLQGVPVNTAATTGPTAYDASGVYNCPDNQPGDTWNHFVAQTNLPQIDRLPLEAVTGWDATVNGNLAEQLQEPSLMGAYEGAGITVLGKGIWVPAGQNPFTDGAEPGGYPIDALLLQEVAADPVAGILAQHSYCTTPGTTTELNPNPYPSNFECNPSSIDGLTIRDSSQGGGGIFVHGWAHNLQIANNRVYNNAGTLSGGITVGQGEFPPAITAGAAPLDAPPSCLPGQVLNTHLPYCLDMNVNVHNNDITSNSSLGDELFSGTLAGGGGASFCTGSDYYKFNYNFVCGNVSSAEGGGVAHMGFIYNGDIEHNSILLNQSTNPTIPTNGGGLMVMGTPDTDPVCGTQIDADCPPGLSDGTGPDLLINANLIQGNAAESGSGGGIRLQQVNGTDVSTFFNHPERWNEVTITNNIIVNNLSGWDGAGISLQDSMNVTIQNNTISSNDSLASSGVLTQSIGTPVASAPAGSCAQTGPTGPRTASCPQSAGVTSVPHTTLLTTTFTGLTIHCPFGNNSYPCTGFSNPMLDNNVIYQNRSFQIGITAGGSGNLNQQNLVELFNASFTGGAATFAPVTPAGYTCPAGVSYWDIGVRGDSRPGPNTGSGFRLNPTYSVVGDPGYASGGFGGSHNLSSLPGSGFVSQYCNGSRVPPTCTVADGCGGPSGFGVPPGIVDASTPNPRFSLTPSATVDEGNNWINVSVGPLSLSDDSVTGGANANYGGGPLFANYSLSSAIDYIPVSQPHPTTDFFGNTRPDTGNPNAFDPGAVEFQGVSATQPTFGGITPNNGYRGTAVPVTITGTNLAGATVTVNGGVTVSGVTVNGAGTSITATFTIPHNASLGAQDVTIVATGGIVIAPGAFLVNGPTLTSINPTSGVTGTTVGVTLSGFGLQDATSVTMSGFGFGNVVTCTLTGTPTFTTVTASCVIPTTAALGTRNVTLHTLDGNAGGVTFAVTSNATVTSITPVSGSRGRTVAVTIVGTALTGATSVNAGAGITSNTIVVTGGGTQLTANLVISSSAAVGVRDVRVVFGPFNETPINPSVTFTVTGATLAFSPVTPALTTGTANTNTKTGTITVRNTATGATAEAVTLAASPNPTVSKVGANGGTFSIVTGAGGGTCVPGFVLNTASSNSCTIVVQYAPGASTATATGFVTVTGVGLQGGNNRSGNFTAN
ncbi:MAG TPA: hypothetical protein VEU11_14195 [Terriglobales bacterium]|nr:hypothetical protein [Terriglobales bacterium]